MAIDLDAVRQALWDSANQLWDKINDPATEASSLPALRQEFFEVNHRLQIVMGKALTAQTDALQAKADKIAAARADLKKVLVKVASATEFVKGVTKFLTVVDSFLDAAKAFMV